MNKVSGFVILVITALLLSASSVTVKKASAIYFGNGACPSGEARDYLGICFPIKECKASLFAAAGTCKVAPEAPKGGGTYTINAPKYQGSPVHLPGGGFIKKGWCAMYPTANRLLAGGNGSGKEVRETCAESGGPGPNLLPIGK